MHQSFSSLWLLAQAMSVASSPSETAEGISKFGLYWIIGVLCSVIVALFGYVILGHQSRMADRDARDKRLDAIQERQEKKLEQLATDMRNVVKENERQLFTLAGYIQQAMPNKKFKPSALGPEPTSSVGAPPREGP